MISITIVLVGARSQLYGQRAPASASAPWHPERAYGSDMSSYLHQGIVLAPDKTYTLGDLIDIAEDANPATHAAWDRAQVAAASLGVARSELYPTIIAATSGRSFLNPPLLNQSFVIQDIGAFEAALNLNYTLVDFGARNASINGARARLLAANLAFNNQHLALLKRVSELYYRLLNAKGLRKAAEVNLRDAQAVQSAVQQRKDNGLATLPDLLEARADEAKANYELQSAIGDERIAFGELSTTLTAEPSHPFNVQELDSLVVPTSIDQTVEDAMQEAYRSRPDLQADLKHIDAARAAVKEVRSEYLPKLAFDGSKGWLRAWGHQSGYDPTYGKTETYDAKLSLTWTLFDGFKRENRMAQTRAEEHAAIEDASRKRDEVSEQVWTAYTDAMTALQERQAATTMLEAADKSYAASLESYRDGVRNILDVLSAERDLAHARSVDVTARTHALTAMMNMSFATGALLTVHPKGHQP